MSALNPNAGKKREVLPGDIYYLGRHVLMCGDATNQQNRALLLQGRNPTLVVTSPPYSKQRTYHTAISNWTELMVSALNCAQFANNVQILANLGVVHKNGEWHPYWQAWLLRMRQLCWAHYSTYIWDKLSGYPGRFFGRMNPSYELVFHLNKQAVEVNKCMPCYGGRKSLNRSGVRKKNGDSQYGKASVAGPMKTPDSVIRLGAVKFGEATGHPAQMPVSLARHLIAAFKADNTICYDPFAGSGTTFLACEEEQVVGCGMEISAAYCGLAIERWNKAHPSQLARLAINSAEYAGILPRKLG